MGKDKKKKEKDKDKEKDKSKKKQKSGKALKKNQEMLPNETAVLQKKTEGRYDWHDWDDDDGDDGMSVEPEDGQVPPELEEVPDEVGIESEESLAETTSKPEVEQTELDSESETIQIQAGNVQKTTQIDTEMVSVEKISDAAVLAIFQALSDENRVKIMNLLAEREMCTSELLEAVNVVQSTMSHHMKVLCEAGLVSMRRQGKRSCYAVRRDTLDQVEAYLEGWKV